MPKNWSCDNDKCASATSPVRLLPTSNGGNMIVCHSCYLHEMSFRRSENERLRGRSGGDAYKTPDWSALEVYKGC